MKFLTIIFILCSSLSTIAQESTTIKPPRDFKRFQIGANFSPDLDYRTLRNNNGAPNNENIIDFNNDNQIVKFGYSTGLNFCYNIKRFVGIELGVQYSNKGFQTKQLQFFDATPGPDPSAPETGKFVNNFHYVDIPLKVNFTVGKKKVRFFTSVGITTNLLIKSTETSVLKYSSGKVERKSNNSPFDYKKVNISPMISVGIDYKINDRMSVRVEPTFRYGVLKIIDAPITGYLWNAGINLSYYFGL